MKQLLLRENAERRVRVDHSGKNTYIVGTALVENVVNKNKRVYPSAVLDEAVGEISDKIKQRNFFAELGHPSSATVTPDRICGIAESLTKRGNIWEAKIQVTNEGCGKILKDLLKCNASIGLSSRALGNVKRGGDIDVVQSPLRIAAIDCVSDPSTGHFVKALQEHVEACHWPVLETGLALKLISEATECGEALFAGHAGFPSLSDTRTHPERVADDSERMRAELSQLMSGIDLQDDGFSPETIQSYAELIADPVKRAAFVRHMEVQRGNAQVRAKARDSISRLARRYGS